LTRHCPNPDCPGLARDGIVAEFVDHMSECVDCGERLAFGPAVSPDDPVLEYNDLRTVFIASSAVQGHLVGGAIESAGIPVYIKGESLQGAVGELAVDVAQVEVQVPVERMDDAREIVVAFESSSSAKIRLDLDVGKIDPID